MLRQFLGKCSYYNEFIENFAIIASPLYDLTKKDVEYLWTETHQKAFEILKKNCPPRQS